MRGKPYCSKLLVNTYMRKIKLFVVLFHICVSYHIDMFEINLVLTFGIMIVFCLQ